MASRTTDETAVEALAEGRPADTDEAAKKGAEGIQDEQQHEKGQRMSRPEGPDEPQDQRAQAPEDGAAAAGADKAPEGAATGPAKEAAKDAAAAEPAKAPAGATDAAGGAGKTGKADTTTSTEKGAEPTGAAPSADQGPDAAASGADAGADAAADSGDDSGYVFDKEPPARVSSGVAEGAGAVISAGLGVVSLTGSWLGTVAGARESLIGQLQTSQGASVAQQIKQVYGDQWHAIALVGGVFALLAMIVGVVVLARPAFGVPGISQAPWIKSVSWAGVILGLIGLLLAVLKFSDAILGLPSVGS